MSQGPLFGHISPSQFGMSRTRRPLFDESLPWLRLFPQYLLAIIHWFGGEGRELEISLMEGKHVGEGREKVGEWLAKLTACL